MVQQRRQPLDDGQAQSQPAGALAGIVLELMVFLEDRIQVGFGDPDAGVPDFDPQNTRKPAATQQDLSRLRVFDRVGHKVAQYLLEQTWVAFHHRPARHDT